MKKNYANMDPLEEVRAIREEISREFKSIHDLGEYLREKKSSPQSRRTAVKIAKRPATRHRKPATHA